MQTPEKQSQIANSLPEKSFQTLAWHLLASPQLAGQPHPQTRSEKTREKLQSGATSL